MRNHLHANGLSQHVRMTDPEPLLERTKMAAHAQRTFRNLQKRPATHARVTIYPDGGVSRLRMYGRLSKL